jgi:hypothetical protein
MITSTLHSKSNAKGAFHVKSTIYLTPKGLNVLGVAKLDLGTVT